MLRLTLDLHNRPLLAETAFACGCFHRFFPSEALDREATETHGRIVSGRSALATSRRLAVDPIISQSMGDLNEKDPHPRVYVYGGKHFACAVEFSGPLPAKKQHEKYKLHDAAELERLPLGTRFASFFGRDGVVRGSDRPEAFVLWPAGFHRAGSPRVRGTHLIHFDQYDYQDPRLIETLLRLPPPIFLEDIRVSPYHRPGSSQGTPIRSLDAIPRAIKKGSFCLC
jgi:hypothetical protein